MAANISVPTIDVRIRIPEEVISEVVRRISAEFKPQKIILFGSYAYGKPRPESDVDLLVVMDTALREVEQALKIRRFIRPNFGLDILVYTPSRLQQRIEWGDSFLREIVAKGTVVYEAPNA